MNNNQIENFIKWHRTVVHGTKETLPYKEQEAYEKGWTDCLAELEKYMADEKKFVDEVLQRMMSE